MSEEQLYPTDPVSVRIGGKEYNLRYSNATMRMLKQKFGSSLIAGEGLKSLDEDKLPELLYAGITNKDGLTIPDLDELIDTRMYPYLLKTFLLAFQGATPEAVKSDPNAPASQQTIQLP